MPKASLDATFCLLACCEEGRSKTEYFDTAITGFTLEVRCTGGKTYYLRYFDQRGRQRQHRIARYGDITFDKARKEAIRLRSEVVLGGDPAKKKEELKAVPTYAELAARHLAYANVSQRRPGNTEAVIRLHLLPRWGKTHVDDIRQPDVAQWLAAKRKEGLAPATIEKIRVTLGRSFELAMSWEIPGVTRNPTKGIPRPPLNNARDRFLSPDEAMRLHQAVAQSKNPQLRHIIGLLLLTGARVSELLHAEWRDIDLARRAWLIPMSKSGKSRHVPLSQAAIDIIERLPRFDRCPYLVPNPQTRKPFTDLKHPWQRARALAGLPDLRIHDLRHSAASFMINAGIDLYAVGKVLGHANLGSTLRYSHLANDTLLAAVEAGAAKMKMDWADA